MARTTSVWTLATLSTNILAHVPSKSNYTNTAVPKVPHPYWWQGPYSSSLVETRYTVPTAVLLPTLSLSEQEPCETRSSLTLPPSPSSGPWETDTANISPPIPVSSGYRSLDSSLGNFSFVYKATEPTSLASVSAYPTSIGVISIASTWLPPSYTQAISFVTSSPGPSTWLGPEYTVVVPLPLSSTLQSNAASSSTPSEHYSATSPHSSRTISFQTASQSTIPATPVIPSTAVHPTDSSSTPGLSSLASSGQLSSTTVGTSVPPVQTSTFVSTISPSVSSQLLPTFSLETSVLSFASSSATGVVVVPSSSANTESSSSSPSTATSLSSAMVSITSSETSVVVPSSTESTLQSTTRPPSSSAVEYPSTESLTATPTTLSPETTSSATRPTAVGSSVRYTLSTSTSPSSSAPADTTTGPPPAPPVRTGAANSFYVTGSERVWWMSFLLPTLFFL